MPSHSPAPIRPTAHTITRPRALPASTGSDTRSHALNGGGGQTVCGAGRKTNNVTTTRAITISVLASPKNCSTRHQGRLITSPPTCRCLPPEAPAENAFGRNRTDLTLSILWWRWGRVELPVQDLQPETTTSVSDGLLSTQQASIGTVLPGPSTSPCGLCDQIRGLTDRASPLNDASTTGGETAASTLTLLP
jgi:hypothetical protein